MNFFEQQDIAKRRTRKLMWLMVLVITFLIAFTSLAFALSLALHQQSLGEDFWYTFNQHLNGKLLGTITLVVVSLVLLGYWSKSSELRAGGYLVAEALHGRLLAPQTQDLNERRLLNIVEEMAIASGIAVPPVYLLEHDAINAFAAGNTPRDAVIGVTRGAIKLLSRDELQGVIAHEFSHIFHGDMRLNMRLVSMLNGILFIGLIGFDMLRSFRYSGHAILIGSGNRKVLASTLVTGILGVTLVIIGYLGIALGNLIKAAICRQRELLADAAAVQYTRNPEGLAGALKKIGGYSLRSHIATLETEEYNHLYFSEGKRQFFQLFSSHPPLAKRIRNLQPGWDGSFPFVARPRQQPAAEPTTHKPPPAPAQTQESMEQNLGTIGQPHIIQLDYASHLLASLPPVLRDAAHEPFAAQAVIYGMLLSAQPDIQQEQLGILKRYQGPGLLKALHPLQKPLAELTPTQRLPLVETTLPALKQLSTEQRQVFKQSLVQLLNADSKIALFPWSLHRILIQNLEPKPYSLQSLQLHDLHQECQQLLSILARAGTSDQSEAERAFTSACAKLDITSLTLLPGSAIKLAQLDEALGKLALVKAPQKKSLLDAMVQCVLHDGQVTPLEAELFRAIADSLGCPVPPLVALA